MKKFIFVSLIITICFSNLFGQWNYNRFFPHFVGGTVGTVAIKAHENAYVSSDWGAYSYTRIDYHPNGIGDRKTYYLFKIDEVLDTVQVIQKIDNYEVKSNILFPLRNENVLFTITNSGTNANIGKVTEEGLLSSTGTFSKGTITSFDALDQNNIYFLFQSNEIQMNPYILISQNNNQIQYRDTFFSQTPIKIDISSYNTGFMSVRDHETGDYQILKSITPFSQWNCIYNAENTVITDINFISDQVGYAILASHTIVKTTNGGTHWDTVYSNTNQTLNQLNLLSNDIIFVCGNEGIIIKSLNGGNSWISDVTNTTEDLTHIFVFNPYRGYTTNMFDCFKLDASFFAGSTETKNWIFGPNPNNGILNIASEEVILKAEIFSVDGKLLLSQDVNNKDYTIHLNLYQSGFYILNITQKDGTISSEKFFFNKGK